MEDIILNAPFDIYGRKATNFYQFLKTLNKVFWIEKLKINRKVDCCSLIGILSLGILKDDEIKISAYEKSDLDCVVDYFNKVNI